MLENIKCYLCNGDDYHILYKGNLNDSEDEKPEDYSCTNVNLRKYSQIVKCNKCGLVYTNPRIVEEELLSNYKNVIDLNYLDERERRIITYKYKFCGKLLDIGCYIGYFLETARLSSWETYGLDVCLWASDYTRTTLGLKVVTGTLKEANFPDRYFDVVTMWDVIEHLTNPVGELQEIHRVLCEDGLLCFTTHNIESVSAKLLGKNYPFLMKMHICHFSPKTISLLLNKVGFEVLKIIPHKRTIRLKYLMGRLISYNKYIFAPLDYLVNKLRLGNINITIEFLGLITVFAYKKRLTTK